MMYNETADLGNVHYLDLRTRKGGEK